MAWHYNNIIIFILCVTTKCVLSSPWPPLHPISSGCRLNTNYTSCSGKVYCVDYIDDVRSIINNNYNQLCDDFMMHDPHYGRYLPLRITLKKYKPKLNDDDEEIPRITYDPEYILRFLISLDLSGNELYSLDTVQNFYNLEILNVSYNQLSQAKFSNSKELQSLKEIDYSFNRIKNIVVNENEYFFAKLNKLNLSHNELIYIRGAIFKNLEELQYLDLSFNFITNISMFTFEGLQGLISLKLSYNNLNSIDSSLFRFHELKNLYLDHNNIKNVFTRDFDKLNNLEILNLCSNTITNLEKGVFENMALLKEVNLSENQLQHLDNRLFAGLLNIESIDLSDNDITWMPQGLFKGRNVSFFSISENKLQNSLKKGIFEGLRLVSVLDLSFQKINATEDYAFLGLENLIDLKLNNNFITFLSQKTFKMLQKLVHLDLSYNKITDINFDKSDLVSLESLSLKGNYIKYISQDHFITLNKLVFLDISYNNISEVQAKSFKSLGGVFNLQLSKNPLTGILEADTFEGLLQVPRIDLSYTLLTSVNNGSFHGMIRLVLLNISHSQINEIQYNAFVNTGMIKTLDLSHNGLNTFNINSTDLKNMEYLLLSNNILSTLSSNLLKGMPRLAVVKLSHNHIETLENEIFREKLNYLDVSYNLNLKIDILSIKNAKNIDSLILSGSVYNLTFKNTQDIKVAKLEISNCDIYNISYLCLYEIKQLSELMLKNNSIKQIEAGAFSNLTDIKNIDLSYNKIKFIQPGAFKDNNMMRSLNLSHNDLSVISYGIFRGLGYLTILDISYNYIENLDSERFYEVESLTELIADHNKINKIAAEDFHGTQLLKLSIGDNPIPCESLANLIKFSQPSLNITAVRYDEYSNENYYGITCNKNWHQPNERTRLSVKDEFAESDKILIDIRDILLNLNDEKMKGEYSNENKNSNSDKNFQVFKNFSSIFQDKITYLLDNKTTEISEINKNTNQLLDRILKVLVATNSLNRTIFINSKDNLTSETVIQLMNNLRQDFGNALVIEKEKILAEIETKLSIINQQMKLSSNRNENKQPLVIEQKPDNIFIEACVGILLVIVVCFVLYKLYKSRLYILNRRSVSTRHIADALDSSNL